MTRLDTRTFGNPGIGGVNHFLQILVRQLFFRKITTYTYYTSGKCHYVSPYMSLCTSLFYRRLPTFLSAFVCLAISSAIRLQMFRSTPSTAAPMAFLIAFALEEP